MKKTAMLLALAAVLAACGDDGDDGDGGGGNGGGTSNVTLTGPLAGSLTNGFYGSASGSCTFGETSLSFSTGFVAVSTGANLCSEALAGREVANATTLFISLGRFSLTGGSPSLDAGTYPLDTPDVLGGRMAVAFVERSGTSAGAGLGCNIAGEGAAVSGTVTVSSVSATSISGSITATFDDGTSASGTFSGSTCGISYTVDPATCEPTGLPDPATCTG
jgi:hypothetical protein